MRRTLNKTKQMLNQLADEDDAEQLLYWRKHWNIHAYFEELGYNKGHTDGINLVPIPLTEQELKTFLGFLKQEDGKYNEEWEEKTNYQKEIEFITKLLEETNFEEDEIFYYCWF